MFLPTACGTPPLSCTASVSNARPYQNHEVLVFVSTRALSQIQTIAHYRTTDTIKTAVANAAGLGTTSYYISRATHGYRVIIEVSAVNNSRHASCSTSFTTR
jgi:hypothetical protein